MAAQDLPPGLTDRYYAPPTATPVPSVAAVRASGLPMAAALSNGTVTPPVNAPVPIPPLAEKAGLLVQRALNGMRGLIGMAPLGAAPSPTPLPLPPPVATAPVPPPFTGPTGPANNFYQVKVQQQAQPLTARAY